MRRAVLALGLLAIFLASSPIGVFGGQHEDEPVEAHAAAETAATEAAGHGEGEPARRQAASRWVSVRAE